MKVKSEREVAQSCPTPSDPMDCSLPGSSAHGIVQAKVLEWGAIGFSMKSTIMYQIFLFYMFILSLTNNMHMLIRGVCVYVCVCVCVCVCLVTQ